MILEIKHKPQAASKRFLKTKKVGKKVVDVLENVPAKDSWVTRIYRDESKDDLVFIDLIFHDPADGLNVDMFTKDFLEYLPEERIEIKALLGL